MCARRGPRWETAASSLRAACRNLGKVPEGASPSCSRGELPRYTARFEDNVASRSSSVCTGEELGSRPSKRVSQLRSPIKSAGCRATSYPHRSPPISRSRPRLTSFGSLPFTKSMNRGATATASIVKGRCLEPGLESRSSTRALSKGSLIARSASRTNLINALLPLLLRPRMRVSGRISSAPAEFCGAMESAKAK